MNEKSKRIRVLYSFPLKIGAGRVCTIAWYQAQGLANAGAEVTVFPASICRDFTSAVKVQPTLAWGKFRLPNRLVGRRAYAIMHDRIVARRLEKIADRIDIIHTWPLGARETLKAAAKLGIPTVFERCNAHTRFAYDVVNKECERIGVPLPPGHEHAWNTELLEREEAEYQLAYRLLCPSEFVVKTFVDHGFAREKLVRHIYGFDQKIFYADNKPRDPKRGLTMISVGVCAVRKGLHFALEAWLKSPASRDGTFLIVGEFLPAYREKLASMLAHPSVKVLGHRNDVPELVRQSDVLVLPSVEEGFGLVVTEAMASGCVPLISDACTDLCKHMENGMVHRVGDMGMLERHIATLHEDRGLLEKLRAAGLRLAPEITWNAAGVKLLDAYREVLAAAGTTRSHRCVGDKDESERVKA
ncbi:MAG TPA: glycosyltransferase family 4 protein [Verrucomicrobiae bacterium]|jgi:glycosyltransferase involved in cell wall biosynthesis|nr:glycosyltransferase family 4 protein [Verrucomicrobiae bacterium]